ncbi:MAG: hypothetical protein GY821_01890 [Gammaproteobacteria bacterium]|nr:hypothetical protein [Gammaproteobacteria bacterium]
MDIRLKHPFSMIVSGPSQAGKTQFVVQLIKNIEKMSTVRPTEIFWCYSEFQPIYTEIAALPNVQLIEGVPQLSELKQEKKAKLVILDDLMNEISKSSMLSTLFSKGCHHWSLSCVHIVQNLFFNNLRNARINANYLVLFKSPSDKLQISNLARQLYPRKSQYFMQSFSDATSEPYRYLLVDLTQTIDDRLRLRTNLFPGETPVVYCPRNA